MKVILTENQFRELLSEITMEEVDERSIDVNVDPTEKQKHAGNYKKGHIYVKGMGISIENPRYTDRKWFNTETNESGSTMLMNHYGYFRNTHGNGKDGDAVDVFLGEHLEDFDTVYVVDQNNQNGEFDESKVMIGFLDKESAKQAYLDNYSKGWDRIKDITSVSIPVFKKWLYRKHKQRKPFAEYVYILKHKTDEKEMATD